MNSRRLFIVVLSLFLFFLSADFTQAVTNSAFLNNFQCIRHADSKNCPTSIFLGDFNTQAWQAKIDNTSYQGFGSAGSVRVDICLDGDNIMWNSPASCWTVADFNYGERALSNVADTSIKSIDSQDTTTDFYFVTINVRVKDASTNTSATGFGRKVSIDLFTAEPSSVQVGKPITVSWGTDSAVKGVTLFWDGAVGTGSEPIVNSGTRTFTPTSAGTALFTLRACGPIGFPGGCISQDRQVTVTPTAVTADIKANGSDGPVTIQNNSSATISWTSTNATSCSVSPTGWTGTSNPGISTGNLKTNDSPKTYSLSCTNGASEATDSVTVNITGGPPPPGDPTVTLTFSPSTVTSGQSTTATWTYNNDTDGIIPYTCTGNICSGTCQLIGKPGSDSGSAIVFPSATQSCTLTASNNVISYPFTATVTVGATHLECINNACAVVSGAGSNTGGCTTAGASCGVVEQHAACVPDDPPETDYSCRMVNGPGPAQCSVDSDCNAAPPPSPLNLEICQSGQTPTTNCGDTFSVVKGNVIYLKVWYDSDGDGRGWEDLTNASGWTLCNEGKNSDLPTYRGVQSCQGVRFEPTGQGSPPYIPGAYRGVERNVTDSPGVVNANWSGTSDQIGIIVTNPPPPPTASNITATQPNYCISGPAATVGWTYSDPSGSPQSAYQVQLTNTGSFNNPILNTGKINSGSNSYFTGQGFLQFNVTYKARVMVWNSSGVASSWIKSNSFKTPSYAYPQVDFSWVANGITNNISPPLNKPVDFTDATVFNGNPNGRIWSWLFGDGGVSALQNPSHTYTAEATYYATLTATDNANQTCSRSKGPLIIQKPIPKWREVAPR